MFFKRNTKATGLKKYGYQFCHILKTLVLLCILNLVPQYWCPVIAGDETTVPLGNIKLFISGSCPILVLTNVLGRLRHTYVKDGVKNYEGPTTS
jgi:hypothetical protein